MTHTHVPGRAGTARREQERREGSRQDDPGLTGSMVAAALVSASLYGLLSLIF